MQIDAYNVFALLQLGKSIKKIILHLKKPKQPHGRAITQE